MDANADEDDAASLVASGAAADAPTLYKQLVKLADKYQRLRAKRDEMRAALKQSTTQSAKLEEELEEAKKTVRTHVQDLDSLNFRHSTLKKRYDKLRESVQEMQAGGGPAGDGSGGSMLSRVFGGGSGGGGGAMAQELEELRKQADVLREEVATKIEENARLSRARADMEEELKGTVGTLQVKLDDLKSSLQKATDELKLSRSSAAQLTRQLAEERERAESAEAAHREQLAALTAERREREQQMGEINQQLGEELEGLRKRFGDKIAFDDTQDEGASSLNLPVFDRAAAREKMELTRDFLAVLEGLRDHLSQLAKQLVQKRSLPRHQEQPPTPAEEEVSKRLGLALAAMPAEIEARFDQCREQVAELAEEYRASADYSALASASSSAVVASGSASSSSSSSPSSLRGAQAFSRLAVALGVVSQLVGVVMEALEAERPSSHVARSVVAHLAEAYRDLQALLLRGVAALEAAAARFRGDETLHLYCNPVLDSLLTNDVSRFLPALRRATANASSRFAAKCTVDHKGAFVSASLRQMDSAIVGEMTTLSNLAGRLAERVMQYRDLARHEGRLSGPAGAGTTTAASSAAAAAVSGAGGSSAMLDAASAASAPVAAMTIGAAAGAAAAKMRDLTNLRALRAMQGRAQRYMAGVGRGPAFPPARPSIPYREALAYRATIERLMGELAAAADARAQLHAEIAALRQAVADAERRHAEAGEVATARIASQQQHAETLERRVAEAQLDLDELRETLEDKEVELQEALRLQARAVHALERAERLRKLEADEGAEGRAEGVEGEEEGDAEAVGETERGRGHGAEDGPTLVAAEIVQQQQQQPPQPPPAAPQPLHTPENTGLGAEPRNAGAGGGAAPENPPTPDRGTSAAVDAGGDAPAAGVVDGGPARADADAMADGTTTDSGAPGEAAPGEPVFSASAGDLRVDVGPTAVPPVASGLAADQPGTPTPLEVPSTPVAGGGGGAAVAAPNKRGRMSAAATASSAAGAGGAGPAAATSAESTGSGGAGSSQRPAAIAASAAAAAAAMVMSRSLDPFRAAGFLRQSRPSAGGDEPGYSLRVVTSSRSGGRTPVAGGLMDEEGQETEELLVALQFRAELEAQRRREREAEARQLRAELDRADRRATNYHLQLTRLARSIAVVFAAQREARRQARESAALAAKVQSDADAAKLHYDSAMEELTEKVCSLTEEVAKADALKNQMRAHRESKKKPEPAPSRGWF